MSGEVLTAVSWYQSLRRITCMPHRSVSKTATVVAHPKTHLLVVEIGTSNERIIYRMDDQRLGETVWTLTCHVDCAETRCLPQKDRRCIERQNDCDNSRCHTASRWTCRRKIRRPGRIKSLLAKRNFGLQKTKQAYTYSTIKDGHR